MFAGRLFHSLGAATEYGVPAERSPLYNGTTSLSGAFIDWDSVRPIVAVSGADLRGIRVYQSVGLAKCCKFSKLFIHIIFGIFSMTILVVTYQRR